MCLWLLSGCTGAQRLEIVDRVWPEPPLTPRVKFVGALTGGDDLRGGALGALRASLLGDVPRRRLSQPMGIAVSPDGRRVYVTNYSEPGVFVFDAAQHRVQELGDERHAFHAPLGIAVDEAGAVYVVDSAPARVIVFEADGRVRRVITDPALERPTGVAIDTARGKLYVADSARRDSANHVVRIFDLDGRPLGILGGRGSEEGKFFFATYLAVDSRGTLYVADTMNGRVQMFDADGRWLRTIGRRGDAPGMFDKPKGVALDGFGNVYVVDSSWSNVQIFNQHGQALLFFGGRGRMPGLLFNPTGIAIDRENRIYVADAFNGRINIYELINTRAEDSDVVARGR